MFNISVIDKNKIFQNELVSKCRRMIINMNFVIRKFDSVQEFQNKDSYFNIGHILMIDEKFLDYENIIRIRQICSDFKNIHILFYGENIHSIPLAYDVKHFYFILKNQMNQKLPEALRKGIRLMQKGYQPFFSITFKYTYYKIFYDDVIHIQFRQRQTCFKTRFREYTAYITRTEFFNSIDSKIFLRISYRDLINLDYVKYYEKPYFIMCNDQKIKASDTYIPVIEKVLVLQDLHLKDDFIKK